MVKVHRVFPSSCCLIASSQSFQFRKNSTGDRKEVVTPFMQDVNYTSRNFATLGPSGLRPPFTEVYIPKYFHFTASGRCQILYIIFLILQNLMFLLNSRYLLFFFAISPLSPEVTELFCRVPSILLIFLS